MPCQVDISKPLRPPSAAVGTFGSCVTRFGAVTANALTLPSVTGPVVGGDVSQSVREGRAGSLLNVFGPGAVREIQRVALEESRLKIPLLLGFEFFYALRQGFQFFPLLETQLALFLFREARPRFIFFRPDGRGGRFQDFYLPSEEEAPISTRRDGARNRVRPTGALPGSLDDVVAAARAWIEAPR